MIAILTGILLLIIGLEVGAKRPAPAVIKVRTNEMRRPRRGAR
jgi:hypothetical protein